jgi:dnd system-associated protein 4
MSRIRVENDYHDLYRALARDDGDATKHKTFETMKDVFMVAFGFGVAANQRTPLGPSREIFDEQLLRAEDRDMIQAAALADDEKALASLEDSDLLLRIAQEYANTGIRIMRKEHLQAQPEQSLASALLIALAPPK